MPYNIEDQENFLKNESPYNMSDEKWKAMQQRIKSNVMAAATKDAITEKPFSKIRSFSYWKISTAAAAIGIAIIIAVALFFSLPVGKQTSKAVNNLANNQTVKNANPEMQLDDAISYLNEAELNLSHQISENEISEQNEYFDN